MGIEQGQNKPNPLEILQHLTPTEMFNNRLDTLNADFRAAIETGDETIMDRLAVDLAWVTALQDLDFTDRAIVSIWIQKDVTISKMQEESEQDTPQIPTVSESGL